MILWPNVRDIRTHVKKFFSKEHKDLVVVLIVGVICMRQIDVLSFSCSYNHLLIKCHPYLISPLIENGDDVPVSGREGL
jgi:hypothetical protein